jgi:hypothetical protein
MASRFTKIGNMLINQQHIVTLVCDETFCEMRCVNSSVSRKVWWKRFDLAEYEQAKALYHRLQGQDCNGKQIAESFGDD